MPGAIVLTDASLEKLNAASLLLGGTRTDNADGTTSLDVTTNTITVDGGANLSAPEISWRPTARAPPDHRRRRVDHRQRAPTPTAPPAIISSTAGPPAGQTADGQFLRVSNGPQRLVVRAFDRGRDARRLDIGAAN